ncbi:hypothetical protein EVAR_10245_1 [Eumeta japonica]|uniref:Uncharacterized protein n=1 Tax=Eumeta variegata TaxID=151549 RepID=A0A4C1TDP3_EUMVA|nr:hypothetical protein EVAR_10245_1 [Eumeta japonica]
MNDADRISLTLNRKRNHMITSEERLAMFSRTQRYNPDNGFLRMNMYQRRPKMSLSAKKVMATVFWDARGIIHIDHFEKVMPSGKHSIHLQAFHGNYWQRLPEIACQQYHQAAKDVVISPKILQCEVKCFK